FSICFVFFFNVTSSYEIYTLSLHDALPISMLSNQMVRIFVYDTLANPFRRIDTIEAYAYHDRLVVEGGMVVTKMGKYDGRFYKRSEEHTSELQSRENLVCRLLLEKKKKKNK